VPLFQDFETYLRSMPVREHKGNFMRLCEYPFWAEERDVKFMSECLSRVATDRNWVSYIAAPAKSGKTSCGLPVFLQGAKAGNFTHYLYCAFDNNNERSFTLDPPNPAANLNTAEKQGAAFALDFIKVLFETPGDLDAYEIPRNDDPPRAATTQKKLDAYVFEKMLGPDARLLIQVDEHREMCSREGESAVSGASFAKGAIEALQSSKMVTVFATHVSRPPVKDGKTTGYCRKALPGSTVDVAQVMAARLELRFPPKLKRKHRQAWTLLKCRLAAKIVQSNLANMHEPDPETQLFLDNFAKAAAIPDVEMALLECIRVCELKRFQLWDGPFASNLLLGEKDVGDVWDLKMTASNGRVVMDRQVSDLVTMGRGDERFVSASLLQLLSWEDPTCGPYNDGRDRFEEILVESYKGASSEQAILSTPLEAAYSWTFACASALRGKLKFGPRKFKIECKELKAERLFEGDRSFSYKGHDFAKQLDSDVLYYADETKLAHPRADIFFRTQKNELVLVDVYGGSNKDMVRKKKRSIKKWIEEQQQQQVRDLTLHGVVLAPFVRDNDPAPVDGEKVVVVVCGEAARDLLGGLGDIASWFEDDLFKVKPRASPASS
jgi:hypothetical protein